MQKAMLSQPMAGKTDEEIVATRERAIAALEAQGYEIVNTLFTDDWYSQESMKERGVVQIPLCFLAKSLENMSLCHAVYFCKGWEQARGCRIEHDAAKAYGLEILYEDDESSASVHECLKTFAQELITNSKFISLDKCCNSLTLKVSPGYYDPRLFGWMLTASRIDVEKDNVHYEHLIPTHIRHELSRVGDNLFDSFYIVDFVFARAKVINTLVG